MLLLVMVLDLLKKVQNSCKFIILFFKFLYRDVTKIINTVYNAKFKFFIQIVILGPTFKCLNSWIIGLNNEII